MKKRLNIILSQLVSVCAVRHFYFVHVLYRGLRGPKKEKVEKTFVELPPNGKGRPVWERPLVCP